VFDEVTGQPDAIATVRAAVAADTPAHAWLITGPPGSGRSTLAYAFAGALIARPGEEDEVAAQVTARTHPDLRVLATEGVNIRIEAVRDAVRDAAYSPSTGRFRVIVVEDADRMTERTSNVLLKALEEPPPRTVWILCAPTESDLLPTIRSRVRSLRLRVPDVDDVATLIEQRDGVTRPEAVRAAREAQSHVGMAHRLATSAEARERRARTLQLALQLRSVAGAVLAAAELHDLAKADADTVSASRAAAERASLLRSLGVEEGQAIPPSLRSHVSAMEEEQKRRATRSVRDGIDRILVDLQSLYRDILLLQLGAGLEPINLAIHADLEQAAAAARPEETLAVLDAIADARRRIEGNVAPVLALEAMLVSAVRRQAT
jgi:DNA polymerase-3 subunit delta'